MQKYGKALYGEKTEKFSNFVTWKRYINQKSPNGIYGFALV